MKKPGLFLLIGLLAAAMSAACNKESAAGEGGSAKAPSAVESAPGAEAPASKDAPAAASNSSANKPGTGTITGHVRLVGKAPGNPVIRMGMDPKCSQENSGKKVAQELVVANENGDLANVFVSLKGKFPKTPVSDEPVIIDQQKCVFVPRVSGARVGQTLEIHSSDNAAHNSHGQTLRGNSFNLMQPTPETISKFVLKDEEVMLRITCDLHSWMFTYVGVVDHPYFAVTGTDGAFQIRNVPPGTYSIEIWHERYGPVTKSVTVTADKPVTVDFEYTGKEEPPHRASIDEIVVPAKSKS
ncbi:MAG TPA: carboxypeptidase regulatory-like domain-containing protein [Terriglobia bacterium]|nr:carboxypeptidase regulatory-like domain-containing protein [Terriglobia bacterium]